MVLVSISEVYDLSTVKDKMTLIGVHTPRKELIQKTYPGLCMNSKYFRIVKTDCVISCVSSALAITPDMVGDNMEDGIAPEDMLNPILYKAVSNDSWSTLEARLNGLKYQVDETNPAVPVLHGSQAFAENDDVTGLNDDFGVYYSLLANRDGFKVAPVQSGISMRGLKPLVFEKYFVNGENVDSIDAAAALVEDNGSVVRASVPVRSMRGRAHLMPRINTTFLTGVSGAADEASTARQNNGMGDGTPRNIQCQMPDLSPVMLAAVIMPPCRKTKLFFRMVCRTWISFEEVRPIQEIASFAQMSSVYAPLVYHSDYNEQSSKMDQTTDMVDVQNADITKVMEGR